MSFHDPIRQSKYLRQTLSQYKKPVGFFIFAGCPLAVKMPDDKWPLIPDVAGLTKFVEAELLKDTEKREGETKSNKECYSLLLNEIEDILSFVRGMKQVSKGATDIRGVSEVELSRLETIRLKLEDQAF